jgi:hypothetical protein
MDKSIPRVSAISSERFLSEYVSANQPVIVVDAMASWDGLGLWTPKWLASQHGDSEVQVYNSLFDLVDIVSLRRYIELNFGRDKSFQSEDYVRWYCKFKDVDFVWADDFFRAVSPNWADLYFFPTRGFVLPGSRIEEAHSVVTDPFPYKGLFVSGRGARTRLHRDPFGSDAILCQFYGSKSVAFYPPEEASKLQDERGCVDPEAPDTRRFPRFADASLQYEDTLRPGEVLFVPGGWFHEVKSISDSISVTWNFVHAVRDAAFRAAMASAVSGNDHQVVDYFKAQPGQYRDDGQR